MSTITRDEAAKRFAELPLPSTSDEHWRFTDLRGFDPAPNGHVPGTGPGTGPQKPMLDLEVSARAVVPESGIEIVSAPEGMRSEPLPAHYDAKHNREHDQFAL